jgi:hypothetical protein
MRLKNVRAVVLEKMEIGDLRNALLEYEFTEDEVDYIEWCIR